MQPDEHNQFGGNAPQPPQPVQPGVVVPGGSQPVNVNESMARFGVPVLPQGMQQLGPQQQVPAGAPGTVPAVIVPQNHVPLWAWITLSVLGLLTIGGAVFGFWAYGERQTYKNDTDAIVAREVETAKGEQVEEDALRFTEEAKNPLKPYTGPSSYGSISLLYPKTWSGYIDASGDGSAPFVAFFHPDTVAALDGRGGPAVALKVEVLESEYSSVVKEREQKIESGELTAGAYAFPKRPNEVGIRFVGKITNEFVGTEILIPLRDKTIVVTTQTDQFLNDFNTYILPNFNFEP
jgi:hypothetical protein